MGKNRSMEHHTGRRRRLENLAGPASPRLGLAVVVALLGVALLAMATLEGARQSASADRDAWQARWNEAVAQLEAVTLALQAQHTLTAALGAELRERDAVLGHLDARLDALQAQLGAQSSEASRLQSALLACRAEPREAQPGLELPRSSGAPSEPEASAQEDPRLAEAARQQALESLGLREPPPVATITRLVAPASTP